MVTRTPPPGTADHHDIPSERVYEDYVEMLHETDPDLLSVSVPPAVHAEVVVAQVFSGYYDLASGGVSTKRANAEFVGRAAADSAERLEYHPVDLAIDPPKRGGDLPGTWTSAVEDAVERVAGAVSPA